MHVEYDTLGVYIVSVRTWPVYDMLHTEPVIYFITVFNNIIELFSNSHTIFVSNGNGDQTNLIIQFMNEMRYLYDKDEN